MTCSKEKSILSLFSGPRKIHTWRKGLLHGGRNWFEVPTQETWVPIRNVQLPFWGRLRKDPGGLPMRTRVREPILFVNVKALESPYFFAFFLVLNAWLLHITLAWSIRFCHDFSLSQNGAIQRDNTQHQVYQNILCTDVTCTCSVVAPILLVSHYPTLFGSLSNAHVISLTLVAYHSKTVEGQQQYLLFCS